MVTQLAVIMDAVDGEAIATIPLDDEFRKHFGNPYAVVHRADLHGVLLDACRDSELIELRTQHRVRAYRQDGDSVRVECEGGAVLQGKALIGADGLRSDIRQRRVRTARVQLDSRLIGDYIYHADGATAEVRNHVMSGLTPAQWYDKLGWLYGGTGLDS